MSTSKRYEIEQHDEDTWQVFDTLLEESVKDSNASTRARSQAVADWMNEGDLRARAQEHEAIEALERHIMAWKEELAL